LPVTRYPPGNYWEFGDYLGIGAGAHNKLTDTATQTVTRRSKIRHPRKFLEQAGTEQRIDTTRVLSADDVIFEYAMNALRLDDGFTAAKFSAATGLPYRRMEPAVTAAIEQGLLVTDEDCIHTTPRGQRYLDELLQTLVPEAPDNARTG